MLIEVRRYPVKSMGGEALEHTTVTLGGVEGDRLWALIEREHDRVVSAKYPRRWGAMLQLRAHRGREDGAVTIVFPGGEERCSDDPEIDEALTRFLGRPVHLTREVPAQATIDRVDPLMNGRPVETPRVSTDGLAGAAPGTFFDYAPIHFVTAATLAHLQQLLPASAIDVARFRPNLVLDLPGSAPFAENGWPDMLLAIGDEVVLRVLKPTPRCAVPTVAQPGLPADPAVVTALARHNRITIPGTGSMGACLGAYAEVVHGGFVETGDRVHIHPA